MKSARPGLEGVLYYGEAVGVVLAWVVGVAVILTAGESEKPTAEPERLANVSPDATEQPNGGDFLREPGPVK